MKKFDGWWMPEDEAVLVAEMAKQNVLVEGLDGTARLTYQYHKYFWATQLLSKDRFRVAVDIGAHVGLWSYWMARDFAHVLAFEPSNEHRACLTRNVPVDHLSVYATALGADTGQGQLVTPPGASGGAYVDPAGTGISIHALDDYALDVIDFCKIDVEGFELDVVRGAEATFRRTKPVIVIETVDRNAARYQHAARDAVDLLLSFGATFRTQVGSDAILYWEPGA
jgi:FkbM family methyltransferase